MTSLAMMNWVKDKMIMVAGNSLMTDGYRVIA